MCASPSAAGEHQTSPGPSDEDPGTAAAASGGQHNVKFLTNNCVLVTNYCGDVANVVDQHFARALSHGAGLEARHGATAGKGERGDTFTGLR